MLPTQLFPRVNFSDRALDVINVYDVWSQKEVEERVNRIRGDAPRKQYLGPPIKHRRRNHPRAQP